LLTALTLFLILQWSGLVGAQNTASELRVATFVLPPFVMQDGDRLTGFSIDLWEEIAARLKVRPSYTMVSNPASFFQLLQSGNVDVGVSAVFFTTEHDKIVDFTYPILNTGLQVMVRESGGGVHLRPLRDWLTLLFSRSALLWLAAALIVMVIPAHVVWLFDRRNTDGVTPTRSYLGGIFHSMVWAGTALASQVQVMPKHWFARMFGLVWMFAGVVFVALYTAQLTALLTAEEIRGAINGPGDLPGKRVGTLATSNPAIYLRKIGADAQETASTEEMYQALLNGNVDAVLFAAASLRYYATHTGQGRVRVVGPEFDRKDVGFVLPLDSPLRKRINSQLLALHEDGTYSRLYAKWFGSE
jgi:polar amino acid transport system substrate-binding protein